MRGSEGKSLASMFATRNAASIAEALRQTVQNQAALADRELAELEDLEARPSEVTGDPTDDEVASARRAEAIERKRESVMRNHNSVFTNGTKLYKLDAVQGGVNIQINSGSGPPNVRAEVMRDNPRAIAAEAQRQLLEEHGSVTDDMLFERVSQIHQKLSEADDDTIEGEVL